MHTIDRDQALAALKNAVTVRGENFVAEQCAYDKDGEPYCMVGMALTELGVPLEVLSMHNSVRVRTLTVYLKDHGFEITDKALSLLQLVQDYQDDKVQWGDALRSADARV